MSSSSTQATTIRLATVASLRSSRRTGERVGQVFRPGAADLLFQVISRRYEQRSIVVTTNLPFKQWDTVFPNASGAVALIERLTHHAEIIPIEGESYRKREAELTRKKRRAAP